MELVVLNQENTPVTTSRKVAEYFGKRHDNVMETIRTIIGYAEKNGQGDALDFQEISYVDKMNREKPMYEMTEDGFLSLVLGFTGEKATSMRINFVKAFQAMKEELSRRDMVVTLPDLGDPDVLRGLLIEYTEKTKELAMKVEEDRPKVESYDNFMSTEGMQSMTADLKALGLKPNNTMGWMREEGYLYITNNTNIARQDYINMGIFVVKVRPDVRGHNFKQTFLTPKGIDYFARKKREGLIPEYCLVKQGAITV